MEESRGSSGVGWWSLVVLGKLEIPRRCGRLVCGESPVSGLRGIEGCQVDLSDLGCERDGHKIQPGLRGSEDFNGVGVILDAK